MKIRYQVREFKGTLYSKQLGVKLRTYARARALVKYLKSAGREVYCAPVKVNL